jgi:hypothetical protein
MLTAGGRTLLLGPAAILRNEDGALLREMPELAESEGDGPRWPFTAPRPAVAQGDFAMFVRGGPRPGSDAWSLDLVRISLESGAVEWEQPITTGDGGDVTLTSPLLTAQGGVLFSRSVTRQPAKDAHRSWDTVLYEITTGGAFRDVWLLPDADRYDGDAVLLPGRWIAATEHWSGEERGLPVRSIVAWDIEGASLAAHGWVTPRGNLQRNRRALP